MLTRAQRSSTCIHTANTQLVWNSILASNPYSTISFTHECLHYVTGSGFYICSTIIISNTISTMIIFCFRYRYTHFKQLYVRGQLRRIPSIPKYWVCQCVYMGGKLRRIPRRIPSILGYLVFWDTQFVVYMYMRYNLGVLRVSSVRHLADHGIGTPPQSNKQAESEQLSSTYMYEIHVVHHSACMYVD